MLCVMKCRCPVTNVCNTTSRSSHMPSTARLSHQAQTVTLSAKSCRDGARGLGAPAAASETRAGSLMIEGDFRSLFRDRQAGEGRRFRALGPGEDPARRGGIPAGRGRAPAGVPLGRGDTCGASTAVLPSPVFWLCFSVALAGAIRKELAPRRTLRTVRAGGRCAATSDSSTNR